MRLTAARAQVAAGEMKTMRSPAAAALAACVVAWMAASADAGVVDVRVESSARTETVRVHTPDGYGGEPVPLIVALHGFTQSGPQVEKKWYAPTAETHARRAREGGATGRRPLTRDDALTRVTGRWSRWATSSAWRGSRRRAPRDVGVGQAAAGARATGTACSSARWLRR